MMIERSNFLTSILALCLLSFHLTVTSQAFAKKMDEQETLAITTISSDLDIVSGFSQVLNSDKAPTIADYQKYFGYSDIEEMQFQWVKCEEKGETPYFRHNKCYQSILDKWSNKTKTPSEFLVWLKKQLPKNPKINILSSEQISQKDTIVGRKIVAQFNNREVEFWRPLKTQLHQTGMLSLLSIDSIPLSVLLKQEGEASVLTALGHKAMLRPLSEEELAQRKLRIERKCMKDPDCAKQMANSKRIEKDQELAFETRKNLADLYQEWCKENANLCNEYTQRKAQLDEKYTEIQKKCEMGDYTVCIKAVKQWLTDKEKASQPFCESFPSDCNQLENVQKRRYADNHKWCTDNPAKCKKSYTNFDKALMAVRGSALNN